MNNYKVKIVIGFIGEDVTRTYPIKACTDEEAAQVTEHLLYSTDWGSKYEGLIVAKCLYAYVEEIEKIV